MNQNSMVVTLINLKEQVRKLYRNRFRIVNPIAKGLIAFIVLFITAQMFPYRILPKQNMILAGVSLLQAFLPLSFLYYFASAFILCNLWKVSFDIFAAFALFVIICAISYFRINGQYSYIAAIVPVLFFFHVDVAIPAVLGIAFGVEALFPAVAGVIIYYFSVILSDASGILANTDASDVGVGLQHVLTGVITNKLFLVMLSSVCLTIIVAALLRKLFYERAWLVAMTLGNVLMAFLILSGRLYFNLDIPVWRVLLEAVLGIFLCLIYEFFRGIGDVSRIEKTVFEDNEYIYYVKAVPKIRLSKAEPNIKVMNEEVLKEEAESEEEEADCLEDISVETEEVEEVKNVAEASEEFEETEEVKEEIPEVVSVEEDMEAAEDDLEEKEILHEAEENLENNLTGEESNEE